MWKPARSSKHTRAVYFASNKKDIHCPLLFYLLHPILALHSFAKLRRCKDDRLLLISSRAGHAQLRAVNLLPDVREIQRAMCSEIAQIVPARAQSAMTIGVMTPSTSPLKRGPACRMRLTHLTAVTTQFV